MAKVAVLLIFNSTRLLSFVLRRGVVTMLADGALECDYVSHLLSLV